jgi:hypothetical protein
MSANDPAAQSGRPAAKPRNPVERIVVWGFILVMLVAVGVEANGKFAHEHALSVLETKIKAIETDPKAPAVIESDVKSAVRGKQPSKTEDLKGKGISNGASRREIYSWFTLIPNRKRELWVYYGIAASKGSTGAEVIEVDTDDTLAAGLPPAKLTPEEEAAAKKASSEMIGSGGPPSGMGGMPPAGGMRGGRGGPPRGGRGGPGGRPDAAGHDAEQPASKPDESKPEGDKAEDDKPEGDKPEADKSDGDKPEGDASADETPKESGSEKDE